ncbi:MAG TPA: hypothetical protein VHE30_14165 [Polyangiaceae bacterium]|nr:hypothetical protein [Polyangiaceae bacterium]
MNLSIFVLSDPKAGEEALGRVFNALAVARESLEKGDDVALVFQGAGTRWPAELAKVGHPARELYDSVRACVAGASRACSVVFGAEAGVKAAGLGTLSNNAVPGTPGLASIRAAVADGRTTLVF